MRRITGYTPRRIAPRAPRTTRGDVLAFIIGFIVLANLSEYLLFIM